MFLMAGEARHSTNGDFWEPIKVGDRLPPGTLIQTPDSGFFTLYLYLGEKAVLPQAQGSGSVYDPAVRPANLLALAGDTIVRIKDITNELSPDGKILKQKIHLALYRGTIQGNVKSNSTFLISSTNGVFTMQPGIFRMSSTGSVTVYEGQGELRVPSTNATNHLAAHQRFDAETGSVLNFDLTQSKNWRHNIWWTSEPAYFDWAKPEPIDRKALYKLPPSRPF